MKENKLLYFFVRRPKKTLCVLSVAALVGCGGGQSSGNGDNSIEELNGDNNTVIEAPSSASALSENSAPDTFNFSNYYTASLNINLAEIAESLEGNIFVVKVIDHDENALFVAAYNELSTLRMDLILPLAHDSVFIEVYSDLEGQSVFIEESFL